MENPTEKQPPVRRILRVRELTGAIRSLLESRFSDLWVEGEVSDLRSPRSGHLYFTLKDADAILKAVIFKSHVRFMRFLPKEGTQVLIRGHLSLYEPRGEYQLICDYIEPKGAGALQAAFDALKEKLRLEGLFDLARKRPIPLLPLRVGIITSPSGAAIQDIIKIIRQGDFKCQLLLYPVSVQGWGAGAQIAEALDYFNRYAAQIPQEIDLLILTRGGGSLKDLWAFNEEIVARAIARSKLPVISAVGHESDTSISDHVADLRVPTPSAAAHFIVQRGVDAETMCHRLHERLIEKIESLRTENKGRLDMALRLLVAPTRQMTFLKGQYAHFVVRLHQSLARYLDEGRSTLKKAQQGLQHLNPVKRIATLKGQHVQLQHRLAQQGRGLIQLKKQRFQTVLEQLDLVSPLNILSRGYSITQKEADRSIVREAEGVSIGDILRITLHQGTLACSVADKKEARPAPEK